MDEEKSAEASGACERKPPEAVAAAAAAVLPRWLVLFRSRSGPANAAEMIC